MQKSQRAWEEGGTANAKRPGGPEFDMFEKQEQKGQWAVGTPSLKAEAWTGWGLQGHGGHGQELGFYSKCNGSH